MAQNILDRGFDSVAVTYTNNDYGQGLPTASPPPSRSLAARVTLVASHEDGRADYSAEVARSPPPAVTFWSSRATSTRVVRASSARQTDTGAFRQTFVLPDAMVATHHRCLRRRDQRLVRSSSPGTDSEGAAIYFDLGRGSRVRNGTDAFSAEAYDAAALILLAMQAAESTRTGRLCRACDGHGQRTGRADPSGQLGRALELNRRRRRHRLCRRNCVRIHRRR